MQNLGIRFAPIRIPLHRRLQTLAIALAMTVFTFGAPLFLILSIYLTVCTSVWWMILIYLNWIYWDKTISERGGRPVNSVRNWTWWAYSRDYFPCKIASVSGATFDSRRNYLFACFPHGILSFGVFHAFNTNIKRFCELFPYHTPHSATLPIHFWIPFFRELALALGAISTSAASLSYVLNLPEGGHVVALVPGGAAESYLSSPRKYRILLKKRKGFVRIALQTGTPLVPVISFGESDVFDQIRGSMLFRIQELVRRFTGVAPILVKGRGFFQYSFGILPQRKEITVLVGKPIDVMKTENPTMEQIEELHGTYTKELQKMFEKYKHQYVTNPEEVYLDLQI